LPSLPSLPSLPQDPTGGYLTMQLQSAGFSPDQVASGILGYTGITDEQFSLGVSAAQKLLSGDDPIDAASPLISAGLAASGVGAPVLAAVSVGLPMVESLIKDFVIKDDCSDGYSIGSGYKGPFGSGVSPICVHNPRPQAIGDLYWKNLDKFIEAWRMSPTILGQGFHWSDAMGSDPAHLLLYRQIHDIELPRLTNSLEDQFYKLFDLAWKSNAERFINGHPSIDVATLFNQVVRAWNAGHPNTGTPLVIQPSDGFITSERDPQIRTTDPVVRILLAGHIDNQYRGPLKLNAGSPDIFSLSTQAAKQAVVDAAIAKAKKSPPPKPKPLALGTLTGLTGLMPPVSMASLAALTQAPAPVPVPVSGMKLSWPWGLGAAALGYFAGGGWLPAAIAGAAGALLGKSITHVFQRRS
jgi:hypothetical protein